MENCAYFYGKEDFYYKYRPSYSEKAIEYLRKYLDYCNIIEVGAGPGNLSKQLLNGTMLKSLTTIEPNSSFLKYQYKNLQQFVQQGRCIITQGCAENMGNVFSKIVIVGQAIHWFDKKLFLQELMRIGCKTLIILENWTKQKIPFSKKYQSNIIKKKERPTNYFKNYYNISFINNLYFDSFKKFSGYMLSMSYAPEDLVALTQFLDDCTEFWNTNIQNQCLCMDGITEVWIGEPIHF